jgi:hypothetical protein
MHHYEAGGVVQHGAAPLIEVAVVVFNEGEVT